MSMDGDVYIYRSDRPARSPRAPRVASAPEQSGMGSVKSRLERLEAATQRLESALAQLQEATRSLTERLETDALQAPQPAVAEESPPIPDANDFKVSRFAPGRTWGGPSRTWIHHDDD